MAKIVKILGLILLIALAAPAYAQAGDTILSASLSGQQEVPHEGDMDGTGTATITLRGTDEVCWDLSVSNITLPATGAHIHEGAAGVAGPVVVPLSNPDANGTATDCTNAEAALVDRIRQNPDAFYVNIHTTDFPAGAVRGQLTMGAMQHQPAPAQEAARPTLPSTGADLGMLPLLIGAALALFGGLLLVRRSRISN